MSKNVAALTHFIHQHFLPILIAAYILAVFLPGPGLFLRDTKLADLNILGATVKVGPSLLMLAFLLFNAGLGIKVSEFKQLCGRPLLTFLGFAANSLVPILLILVLRGAMSLWHSQEELQNLLTGLALIVAMPIAGSSTAWSQNANGNLSLSLGLVLISTLLSPLSTPLVLHFFSWITAGDFSEDLRELAQQGTNAFMCLTVVLPSLAGIGLHFLLGEARVEQFKPYLKLANYACLLLLNYSNAATSLPQAMLKPDPDFLLLILLATVVLCSVAFGAGLGLAKVLKADKSDTAALMFGLGMNNNGTGLVLAASTLCDHPQVLLPMIFYTLAQQVIAALVDRTLFSDA